jgi:hypothetical protein
MKPIVINYKNRERIEKAIAEAQGRATERTINFFTIMSAPLVIKKEYGISMKALEGCVFWCDPNAQDFPNAYKYKAMSTQFRVEVSHGSFKVTAIVRDECFKAGRHLTARLTEDAKSAILAKMFTKAVSFYGCGYSGTLSAREICELGLFDEAVKAMDEAIKAAVLEENGKRYISDSEFLAKCMSKYYEKHHRNFKF